MAYAFVAELVGGERDGPVDLFRRPFLPGAAVEPEFGLGVAGGDVLVGGGERGFEAEAVGAVGVGHIAGGEDDFWFDVIEQVADGGDVFGADRELLDLAGVVEGHVQEVDVFGGDAAVAGGVGGFAAADEALDGLDFRGVDVAGMLLLEEFFDVAFDRGGLVRGEAKDAVEALDELGIAEGIVVEDAEVAADHVGDVDLVALLDEAGEGAAHADDVVVGVRGEDDDAAFLPLPAGQPVMVSIRRRNMATLMS